MTTETTATAAASGAKATERFAADKLANVADTPPERVSMLAREVLDGIHATIRKHAIPRGYDVPLDDLSDTARHVQRPATRG